MMKFKMEYRITKPERLRELCIKNRWFTNGDNEQYEKLFMCNDRTVDDMLPKTVREIAALIWICSSGCNFEDIKHILQSERRLYIETLAHLNAEETEELECEPLPFE